MKVIRYDRTGSAWAGTKAMHVDDNIPREVRLPIESGGAADHCCALPDPLGSSLTWRHTDTKVCKDVILCRIRPRDPVDPAAIALPSIPEEMVSYSELLSPNAWI